MKINKFEVKKILQIALPTLVAWIGHIGYGVSDNLMVAKILGSEMLAVSGLATSFYTIFLMFGMGAAGIVVSLIAETFEVKKENLSQVNQNCLGFCIIVGVLIFLTLFFCSDYLIPLINSQAELNGITISYVKIISPAPIFIMIFYSLEKFSEGISKSKYSMYTVIFCNLLNVFLNYSFLTGSFGLPNLGVKGTALGTLFVNTLEAFILLLFCFKDKIAREGMKFKMSYFSLKDMKEIARLGIPLGFFTLFEMAAYGVGGFFTSKISIHDMAAHQILLWIANVILTPIFAFNTAFTARIAANNALGNKEMAFKIGYFSIIITAVYLFISLAAIWVFKFEIATSIFTGGEGNDTTIGLIALGISVIFFSEMLDGVQLTGNAVLRGYKDTQIPFIFSTISYLFICIPFSYYLCVHKEFGVCGMWIGIAIGMFFQCAFTCVRFLLKFNPNAKILGNSIFLKFITS